MPQPVDSITTLSQVLELVYLFDADMTQALERDGLTKSRVPLTWELQQRGPSTQKSLADALGTTPRNVTGLVDALVETGFVTRGPHPTDRRATLVALTRRGTAVMSKMVRDRDELADQLFGGMSSRELGSFSRSLESVLDVLRSHLEAP